MAITSTQHDDPAPPVAHASQPSASARVRGALSFRSISAIYIFIALFILFSLWVPTTFLNAHTWRALFDNEATTGIVSVALVIPLAAGAFDLAIGAEVGMGAILSASLLSKAGLSVPLTIVLVLLGGAVIGLCTALLVVLAHIDSFIATLGVSSVLLALIQWISGGQQILNLGSGFKGLANNEFLGVQYPVYLMFAIAIIVWYVLEGTPAGRRVYARGGNVEAARLSGVRTGWVMVGAMMSSGIIAAFAGLLISSQLNTGDPTVGPSYLLPAFAAAFLGSTQFRGGRYNVWGTLVAVYVLATGVKGLQLAGAPVWIPDLFNGVALLIAVGMANFKRTAGRASAIRRVLRRSRAEAF